MNDKQLQHILNTLAALHQSIGLLRNASKLVPDSEYKFAQAYGAASRELQQAFASGDDQSTS
jgi:hypothetical protein